MKLPVVALLLLSAPVIAGCGDPFATGPGEAGDGPRVVASFYPLQYVAQRVAGDHAEVVNLTSPGAEPHDLELTPAQTAQMAQADLALYQKGFQPAVDDAVEQSDIGHVVEAGEIVGASSTQPEDGDDLADGDPHFWLDPTRLAVVAEALTDELTELDPDHAGDYAANLADLREELAALDQEYRQGLARCEVDTVVVSHDAFGYLEPYGLHFEAVAGLSPDAEPSPAHLAEIQELIRREGVTTVFSEPLAGPRLAETIADDLGVRTDVLDPIEGLSESTRGEDYLSLMRENLAALRKANKCR